MCCFVVHYSTGRLRSQHILDVLLMLNKSALCLVPPDSKQHVEGKRLQERSVGIVLNIHDVENACWQLYFVLSPRRRTSTEERKGVCLLRPSSFGNNIQRSSVACFSSYEKPNLLNCYARTM